MKTKALYVFTGRAKKLKYNLVKQVDVLVLMTEIENSYPDMEKRWWKLRGKLAVQKYAQKSVHLTVLRCGLAVSIFWNVILIAVMVFIIGGK